MFKRNLLIFVGTLMFILPPDICLADTVTIVKSNNPDAIDYVKIIHINNEKIRFEKCFKAIRGPNSKIEEICNNIGDKAGYKISDLVTLRKQTKEMYSIIYLFDSSYYKRAHAINDTYLNSNKDIIIIDSNIPKYENSNKETFLAIQEYIANIQYFTQQLDEANARLKSDRDFAEKKAERNYRIHEVEKQMENMPK